MNAFKEGFGLSEVLMFWFRVGFSKPEGNISDSFRFNDSLYHFDKLSDIFVWLVLINRTLDVSIVRNIFPFPPSSPTLLNNVLYFLLLFICFNKNSTILDFEHHLTLKLIDILNRLCFIILFLMTFFQAFVFQRKVLIISPYKHIYHI